MNRPTITQARRICEALKARGVIILAFTEDNFAGASYGETKGECGQLGRVLDKIASLMGSGFVRVWDARPVTPDEGESEADRFRRYLRENAEEVHKWPEWMRIGAHGGSMEPSE
ncbi:MAG TPA: hypothetical protein VN442_14280 [Bryobacteraceae bacterium]|nr:hypothetical protein [Bryobacteraceae bacterium]